MVKRKEEDEKAGERRREDRRGEVREDE